MKKIFFLVAPCFMVSLACCFVCGCSGMGRRAQIIGTLLEIRTSEEQKSAAMAQETRSFEKAKHFFLETKKNPESLTRDDCRRMFGEAASEFSEGWGYKPETSTWLKGEKIFLFFDDKGSLSRWEYLPS